MFPAPRSSLSVIYVILQHFLASNSLSASGASSTFLQFPPIQSFSASLSQLSLFSGPIAPAPSHTHLPSAISPPPPVLRSPSLFTSVTRHSAFPPIQCASFSSPSQPTASSSTATAKASPSPPAKNLPSPSASSHSHPIPGTSGSAPQAAGSAR